MDHSLECQDVEREIERLMTERGVDRVEAILILGNRSGEVFGDGDLICLQPLTDAQRRRLGLGRDFREVLAEQRAREAREAREAGQDLPEPASADDGAAACGASRSHGVSPRRDPA